MSNLLNAIKAVFDFMAYAGGFVAFLVSILFIISLILDKDEEEDDDE